jgi:hypothetical protein
VPEGFEDIDLYGSAETLVQVKSRQARRGLFDPSEVANHILDGWIKGRTRGLKHEHRFVLVLETGVDACESSWEVPLEDTLAPDHAVRVALARLLRGRGDALESVDSEVSRILASTSVFVLPWSEALDETLAFLAEHTGLSLGSAAPVAFAVQALMATAADENASRDWGDRVILDVTSIERTVSTVAALINVAALEVALRDGICEVLDLVTPLRDATFYEGISSQPGHLAAGLVVGRPEIIARARDSLDVARPVLLSGPSGVGKSAVLWGVAAASPEVAWYRLLRLDEEDIPALTRLAAAVGAGASRQIGFIADGIGTGRVKAWDSLVELCAPLPGVRLLGSIRREDSFTLRSLAECSVIYVDLDELLAQRIHSELVRSGASQAPHWRESFEASAGLTMEYTHLLSRGERLGAVVGEQINQRIAADRHLELDVLAVGGVAHAWGASISLAGLDRALHCSDHELSAALHRIVDEHLLQVDGDALRGLHQVRSNAIVEAVHRIPPPQLATSVSRAIALIPKEELSTFVALVLRDHSPLDDAVVDSLVVRVNAEELALAARALTGLRLVDFYRGAQGWADVLERNDVAPAFRGIAIQLSLLDSELVDAFRPEINAAVTEIRSLRQEESPLRDSFLARVNPSDLLRKLLDTDDLDEASQALRVLHATGNHFGDLLDEMPEPPLVRALIDADLEGLGAVLGAAYGVSKEAADELLTGVGGLSAFFACAKVWSPWLYEQELVQSDEGEVIYRARLLFISDRAEPEQDSHVRQLGQLAIACLPDVFGVDIQGLGPGEVEIRIGDYVHGQTGLLRQYSPSSGEISWHQDQARVAVTLFDTEPTQRLATAIEILDATAAFLEDMATVHCQSRGRDDDQQRLEAEHALLLEQTAEMAPAGPPLAAHAGLADSGTSLLDDPLHSLVHAIVDNLAPRLADSSQLNSVAAFLGDTLPSICQKAAGEDWHLVGYQEPPASLSRISATLADLHAVIAELAFGTTTPREITKAARSGPTAKALQRSAALCRRNADARHRKLASSFQQQLAASDVDVDTYSLSLLDASGVAWPPRQVGVAVNVATPTDWPACIEKIAVVASNLGLGFPTVLAVACVNGRPLRDFVCAFTPEARPATDASTLLEVLPEPHVTPLADLVRSAINALSELSGAWELEKLRGRRDPALASVVDESTSRLHACLAELDDLPADTATIAIHHELDLFVRRVDEEPALVIPAGESFAAKVFGGQFFEPTSESELVTGIVYVAALWDVDSDAAVALLQRDT